MLGRRWPCYCCCMHLYLNCIENENTTHQKGCQMLYVCMHKHARLGGLGACFLRKILGIRCSEIASGAILGQKQSCSSYMARGVLHAIFGCPRMHLLSQLTLNSKRERTKVGRTAGGVTSLGRELVNSLAPEIVIYLRTYLCTCIFSLQRCKTA